MYKSKLQEVCQRQRWPLPEYNTVREGPDHRPSFSCNVGVNGQTFASPPNCRSAKDAQNMAAQWALHQLAPPSVNFPPPQPPAPYFPATVGTPPHGYVYPYAYPTHEIQLPVSPPPSYLPYPTDGLLAAATPNPKANAQEPVNVASKQQSIEENVLNSVVSAHRPGDDHRKGTLHVYKNLLQQYAQKKALGLPIYSSETEGPPHAPRFRSKVCVDGKTFGTQEFFSTLKEAEQAVAKVAYHALSLDVVQEDVGLYKNLLQEFTQRKGLLCPTYETTKSGPSHAPVFASTVQIGGSVFRGTEARTKKHAEMNAAKVACSSLIDGNKSHRPQESSKETSNDHSTPVSDGMEKIEEIPIEKQRDTSDEVFRPSESSEAPSDSQCRVVSDERMTAEEEEKASSRKRTGTADEEALDSKRPKISPSDDVNANADIPDPSPPPPPPSSCCAVPSDTPPDSGVTTAAVAPGNGSPCTAATPPCCRRIVVLPRETSMAKPSGCTPSNVVFSDDEWIAYRVDSNQNGDQGTSA